MALTLKLNIENIAEAMKNATIEEKYKVISLIENDLLSEWDYYEESDETKSKVAEALVAYSKGDVVELKDLM